MCGLLVIDLILFLYLKRLNIKTTKLLNFYFSLRPNEVKLPLNQINSKTIAKSLQFLELISAFN